MARIKLVVAVAAVAVAVLSLRACWNADLEHRCPLTTDSVSIVDALSTNNTDYHLVLRISGWHDKVEILELYDQLPTFDQCRGSTTPMLYGESLELSQTVKQIYLVPQQQRFEIDYAPARLNIDNNLILTLR